MFPVRNDQGQRKSALLLKEERGSLVSSQRMNALLSNQYLELIIMPTEQCNFRCTYCYEDFSIGRMRQETINAIKMLIQNRSSELNMLKISWFGGEPLSAKSIVYDISTYAKTCAKQYGYQFDSSMTTNGFALTPTVMQKLLKCHVRDFQVSLDGAKDQHDKTRLRINQSGSFDYIWNNLILLKKSNIQFNMMLRLHVTPDNFRSLFDLIDLLKENFKNDDRFSLFFKPIENLGGANADKINIISGSEQFSFLKQLENAVDHKMKIVKVDESSNPYICYASRPNSLVIRADGRIGKCTVALSSNKNTVGYLQSDGSLAIQQEKLQPWLRGLRSQDADILACPLSKMK